MAAVPNAFIHKSPPRPSLMLVTHPESDSQYVHFQAETAAGPQPAATAAAFDPAASAFSFVNAWWLAEAALLSYWSADEAKNRFLGQAGLQSQLVDREGTQCYVASNGTFAIVAFRGTQPDQRADVWADFEFVPRSWPGGGDVHEGFQEALDVVWNDLTQALNETGATKVWFTGHSLGAAVATLAADRFGQPAGLYTFGSPRLGDGTFTAAFNARHATRSFRYVNDHDVVTHVPPSIFNFRHVDRELHVDANGHIGQSTAGPGKLVIDAAADYFTSRVPAVISGASLLPPAVIDHTPRRYSTFAWNAFADAAGT
jgi:triacylglycerol lipase